MEVTFNNNVSEDTMERGGNDDVVKWGEVKDDTKREGVRRIRYGKLSKQQEQQEQQIIEIVRHLLAKNHDYIVHGHWFCRRWKCKHKSQCKNRQQCEDKGGCQHEPHCLIKWQCKIQNQNKQECEHEPQCRNRDECQKKVENQSKMRWQRENECQHRWRFLYTQESLENCLKGTPKRPIDFFTQYCDECNKENKETLISSFLYTPRNSNKKPIEIICHLGWNNHYRVFGNWKCFYCKNRWSSAYTWISLQKFIEQKHMSQGNFYVQGCNKCKHYNCTISSYKPLELSNGIDHKRNLCAKCQNGDYCTEIDNYYGH